MKMTTEMITDHHHHHHHHIHDRIGAINATIVAGDDTTTNIHPLNRSTSPSSNDVDIVVFTSSFNKNGTRTKTANSTNTITTSATSPPPLSTTTTSQSSSPINASLNKQGPFERASNSRHQQHSPHSPHYPFFYSYPLTSSSSPSTSTSSSTNQPISNSAVSSVSTNYGQSSNISPISSNVSIIDHHHHHHQQNDSDMSPTSGPSSSPTSPSILSSNMNSTSPLSSLNTSALVRTISNGSTFGPIPNWPICANQSSSSKTDGPNGPNSHQHQSKSPQSGTHDVSGHNGSSLTSTSQNAMGFGSGSTSTSNSSTNSLPTILATTAPAQNNVPIKLNLPLIFGENYVLTTQIEASNLYRCIEMNSGEEFWCKVVLSKMYYDFLAPHLRMDDHDGINQVKKIIIGGTHTFILFSPSYGDLHSYVRHKRKLRESEAMPLFRQIVQIVADCHSHGIILRDLKLRKFIFSNKERTQLKLETLEGASLFDDDDTLTDKHGCPAYVSPEILLSNSFSGLAADCWGMGVILYTMLVGRYPFHDVNPSSVFCKIRRGTYHIPDSLSKHAKCLIRSLMYINPKERLTADDVLAHRWFQPANASCTPCITVKRNFVLSTGLQPNYQPPGHSHSPNQSPTYQQLSYSNSSHNLAYHSHPHHHHHFSNHHYHHHNHHHQFQHNHGTTSTSQQQNQQHTFSPPATPTGLILSAPTLSIINSNNNGQQQIQTTNPMTTTTNSTTTAATAFVPNCCLNSPMTNMANSFSNDQIVPDVNNI